jgi:hypothetical protein
MEEHDYYRVQVTKKIKNPSFSMILNILLLEDGNLPRMLASI